MDSKDIPQNIAGTSTPPQGVSPYLVTKIENELARSGGDLSSAIKNILTNSKSGDLTAQDLEYLIDLGRSAELADNAFEDVLSQGAASSQENNQNLNSNKETPQSDGDKDFNETPTEDNNELNDASESTATKPEVSENIPAELNNEQENNYTGQEDFEPDSQSKRDGGEVAKENTTSGNEAGFENNQPEETFDPFSNFTPETLDNKSPGDFSTNNYPTQTETPVTPPEPRNFTPEADSAGSVNSPLPSNVQDTGQLVDPQQTNPELEIPAAVDLADEPVKDSEDSIKEPQSETLGPIAPEPGVANVDQIKPGSLDGTDKENNSNLPTDSDKSKITEDGGDSGNLANKDPKDIKTLNLSDRGVSAGSNLDTKRVDQPEGAKSVGNISKLPSQTPSVDSSNTPNDSTQGAGSINPVDGSEGESPKTGGAKNIGSQAKDIANAVSNPQETAKSYAKDQAKRLAVQAGSAAWGFIAPLLPWIALFVFLFVALFTVLLGGLIWAYCFEQGQVRDTIEAALNVAEGDNVGAAVNVTGVGITSKSELREYFEQDGGICKTINPDFCGSESGSDSFAADGGGVGIDNIACLTLKSSLSPELRAFMRTLTVAEGTPDFLGYFRLVGGKAFPTTNKTHPGAEDIEIFRTTGLNSDAFGRYQMLSTTWSAWAEAANVPVAKPGVNGLGSKFYDISPQYQDQAVANQLKVNGVESDLKSKGIVQTLQGNSFVCQWASVPAPHSGCSQKNQQSGGFVSNYEKLLAEEKSPGGCGQGGQDLQQANQNTATLQKFDRVFSGYGDNDKIDLGAIISGGINANAQFTIPPAKISQLKTLEGQGKVTYDQGGNYGSSFAESGQISELVVDMLIRMGTDFDSIRVSSLRRNGGGRSSHDIGQAIDLTVTTKNGKELAPADLYAGDTSQKQGLLEFADYLAEIDGFYLLIIHSRLGPDILSRNSAYTRVSGEGEAFSKFGTTKGKYGLIVDDSLHFNHWHISLKDSGSVGNATGGSPQGAACNPCGSQNGSSNSVGVGGSLDEKVSIIEKLIKDGKLTVAAESYNLLAIKDGKVNEKNLDTVIKIASSDKFENINLISWYRDTAFSGLPDEPFHDNNKNGRAFDVGSIKKNGVTYSHLDVHNSNGPSQGIEAWVEFTQLLKSTGNVKQIITDSPFTSRLRSISGFTASSGQGTTSNIRIAEAPGHENHFHVDVDVPDSTANIKSNRALSLFGGIQANAEFGTKKPSSYSDLEEGHKEFLEKIAKERGYIGYKDAGKESSEMRAAFEAMKTKASSEGFNLELLSGYRSYNDQVGTYFSNINRIWSPTLTPSENIEVNTDYLKRAELSAPPGYSEHSTGLGLDIVDSTRPVSRELNAATYPVDLANWLETNTPNFGFKLSYPKGYTAGAGYEPWHFVFVGNSTYKNSTPLESLTTQGAATTTNCGGAGTSNFANGDLVFPTDSDYQGPGPIQSFGACRSGGSCPHAGIDLVPPIDQQDLPWKIFAMRSGKVTSTGGSCNEVAIDHGDGTSARYLHNDSVSVKIGDQVRAGQEIAKMGVACTAVQHLHFEYYVGGQPVDPATLLLDGSKNVKSGIKTVGSPKSVGGGL